LIVYAARRKKVKRFVIDVNCYITFFINKETDWLLQYIVKNKIEVFIDHQLLLELVSVLNYPRVKKLLPLDTFAYVNFVRLISTQVDSSAFNIQSPDREDNYLFDLALSAHAKLLVTGDHALLHWNKSPIDTISLPAFNKYFR
jgi:putative PIN family toxin of toxin-antitoxin system